MLIALVNSLCQGPAHASTLQGRGRACRDLPDAGLTPMALVRGCWPTEIKAVALMSYHFHSHSSFALKNSVCS